MLDESLSLGPLILPRHSLFNVVVLGGVVVGRVRDEDQLLADLGRPLRDVLRDGYPLTGHGAGDWWRVDCVRRHARPTGCRAGCGSNGRHGTWLGLRGGALDGLHPWLAGRDLAGAAEYAVDGDVLHAQGRPRWHHPGVLPRDHGALRWCHCELSESSTVGLGRVAVAVPVGIG